jgi:hypothetical protein
MKEEKELFKTSSLTARKQHVPVLSQNRIKNIQKDLYERFNDQESLFNT